MVEAKNYNKIAVLLVGGQSSRMGSDKFLLEMNGMPQWQFMVEELSIYFDSVFISCRVEQTHHFPQQKLVLDPAKSIGPMGGIVQAFHEFEEATSLFFVGCDLPNFKVEIAMQLFNSNEPNIDVCAAKSDRKGFAEPLVAIWNRSALPTMEQRISSGDYALYKCMSQLRLKTVSTPDRLLKNVNRPTDLRA